VTVSPRTDRRLVSLFPTALILGVGLVIATGGVFYPPAIAGAAGAVLTAGAICWLLGSAKALQYFPLLLIIAGTKFRGRDATALISGSVDSQVMFELGVYAITAVIVLLNVASIEEIEGPAPLEIALFAYTLIALASVGWSVSPAISAVRATQQLLLLATVYFAARVIEPKLLFRSFGFQILAYVVVCASLAMVFPSFNGTKIGYLMKARRFSWFAVHPVSAATESGMALVFLTGLALFDSGWKTRLYRIPFWIYACALLSIILATRTRTAMFSTLAAMSALYMVRYKRNAGAWIVGLCIIVGGFLFVLVAPEVKQSIQLFVLRGQDANQFASLTGRTELWKQSILMFTKRPILGYGFVASRAMLLQVLPWAGEAHNALVESLLDVGFVGATVLFVPFMSGLIGSLMHLNRWRPGDDATIAWVAGALIFLAMDGIPMASFAGFLTYDPVLMMTATVVFQAIRCQRGHVLLPRRIKTVRAREVHGHAY
jgi:O-antigen ligase